MMTVMEAKVTNILVVAWPTCRRESEQPSLLFLLYTCYLKVECESTWG